MRPFELAFPGPLRDQLVAAVLSGAKTTTTGLVIDYEVEGDPLPETGERFALLDSAGRPVAVIEMLEVRVLPPRRHRPAARRRRGRGPHQHRRVAR